MICCRGALPARRGQDRQRRHKTPVESSFDVAFVEGVADALVGGAGLAVDAVGVDAEQDGDTMAGAARVLGGGHADAQPEGLTRDKVTHG